MHATDLLPSPPRRGIRSFLGVPSKKDGPAKRSSFGAIFLKNKSRSGAGTEKELDVIMKHLVQKEHEDALSDKSEKKNLFQRLKLLPPTATKRESTPTTIVTAPEEEPAQCSTNDDKEFDFDGYSTWVFEETASPESEYPFLVFSAEEVSDDLALLEIQTITSDGESNSREIMLDFSELEQPNSEPGAVEISDSSHSSMRAPFDERLAESHQPPDPVLQQASLPRGPFNNVIRPSMAELSKQWTMRSKTFVEKLTQAQRCASSHSTQQQRSLPSCFFVEFCTNEDAVSDNETQATMKHAEPTRSSQKALSNMLSEAMKNGSILLAATFETFNPKTEDEKEGSSIIDKKSENTKKGSMMTNYKTDTENTQSQKAAAKPRPEKYQAMADLLDEDDDPEPQAVPKEEKVDVTGSKWKYQYFSSDAFRLSLSPSGWETEQPSENNPNTYTLVEFAADKEHDATVWQDSFTGHYTPKNWSTDSNYDAEDEKEKDTSVSTTAEDMFPGDPTLDLVELLSQAGNNLAATTLKLGEEIGRVISEQTRQDSESSEYEFEIAEESDPERVLADDFTAEVLTGLQSDISGAATFGAHPVALGDDVDLEIQAMLHWDEAARKEVEYEGLVNRMLRQSVTM